MRLFLFVILSIFLSSCLKIPSVQDRHMAAETMASEAGWQSFIVDTGDFSLTAFAPADLQPYKNLTIYIEGDGFAWATPDTPAYDPTPVNPVALKLALKDSFKHAIYLARPCQYVTAENRRNCHVKYWTNKRFSPEVIGSVNEAITQLMRKYGAQKLILVGYSGGGAIATLVAARRYDVEKLITVAGNLDIAEWTRQKHLSPLVGSLNPADAWHELIHIPQLHYIGGKDSVISPALAKSYQNRFPKNALPKVIVMPEFDHHCCWVDIWNKLDSNYQIAE
jgi:pimeloyl-ACP methyl ester carboxylesterase